MHGLLQGENVRLEGFFAMLIDFITDYQSCFLARSCFLDASVENTCRSVQYAVWPNIGNQRSTFCVFNFIGIWPNKN
jgi:hypothetical protein